MKFLICAVLLLAAVTKADEDNDDWPCYMKKCGKKSANLEECLVHHANRALDSIMKGDPTIGIPQLNELVVGNLAFGQNDSFKLNMQNVVIYGVEHIHVSSLKWNFDQKTVDLELIYNSAITTAGDYRSNGNFKGRDVTGAGKMNLICVGGSNGGKFTYKMSYELLKVLGRDYVQIKDRVCTRTDGFRLNFNNILKTKQQGASDLAFLNRNSNDVSKAFNPVFEELICIVVSKVFNAVFYNFPLDIMFDEN